MANQFCNSLARLPFEEDSAAATPGIPANSATAGAALKWPANLPAQVAAIRRLLSETGTGPNPIPDPVALADRLGRKSKPREELIRQILETLAALGQLA